MLYLLLLFFFATNIFFSLVISWMKKIGALCILNFTKHYVKLTRGAFVAPLIAAAAHFFGAKKIRQRVTQSNSAPSWERWPCRAPQILRAAIRMWTTTIAASQTICNWPTLRLAPPTANSDTLYSNRWRNTKTPPWPRREASQSSSTQLLRHSATAHWEERKFRLFQDL